MTNEELTEVIGGISTTAIVGIVGTIVMFICGFLDGYMNPIKCGK